MGFYMISPLFTSGQPMPVRFTRDGDNLSPPLEWHGAPEGTRSFALVMDDAVTGQWHWGVYDLTRAILPEGAGAEGGSLRQAVNDFGRAAYDGPAPPPDETYHPYRFRLAALGCERLNVPEVLRVAELRDALFANLIEEVEFLPVYTRIDPGILVHG